MSNIINAKKLTLYELTSHGSEAFSFGFSSSFLLISSCLLCSCIILSLRRFSLLNCLVISSIWRFNSSQRVSAVSAFVVKLNNNKTMDGKYASDITNNYRSMSNVIMVCPMFIRRNCKILKRKNDKNTLTSYSLSSMMNFQWLAYPQFVPIQECSVLDFHNILIAIHSPHGEPHCVW